MKNPVRDWPLLRQMKGDDSLGRGAAVKSQRTASLSNRAAQADEIVKSVCPYCAGEGFSWEALSGRGTVHSWIRYQRPYLDEFAPLMPYSVLTVGLEEGARLFGRLADAEVEPWIGMPVQAIIERWPGGRCIHAFTAT